MKKISAFTLAEVFSSHCAVKRKSACRQLNNKTSPQPSPTLGEGAQSLEKDRVTNSCVSTENSLPSCLLALRKCAAFTLAEVLITLAIIGVVAAMTIPTLIAKHQKKVTATKLEQSYSILAQALTAAQVEYGEMSGWDYNLKDGIPSNSISREDYLTNFAKMYILPYIKSVKDYGYVNLWTTQGYRGSSWTSYYFMLPTGALIETTFSNGCDSLGYDENNNCVGESLYLDVIFRIDVNGFKAPNQLGKDIFLTSTNRGNKFQMYQVGLNNFSRDRILRDCKSNKQACGYLIQLDGWQIKDDYPW